MGSNFFGDDFLDYPPSGSEKAQVVRALLGPQAIPLTASLASGSVTGLLIGGVPVSDANPLTVQLTGTTNDDPAEDIWAAPTRIIYPGSMRAAFGQLMTAEERPSVNLAFHYSINPFFVSTSSFGGGTVTQSGSQAILSGGSGANSSASLTSKYATRYVPGQGVTARFTAVFTGSFSDAAGRATIGLGDDLDGFFFCLTGSSFGTLVRKNGVDTFTSQSQWNGVDRYDGFGDSGVTLQRNLGNVYGVRYQWLGYGAIRYFVEDPTTGYQDVVHTVRYANANTGPSIRNPTLPLWAKVVNGPTTGSTFTLKSPSMGAYNEGPAPDINSLGSAGQSKSGITTEVPVLSILNLNTYQNARNRVRCSLTHATLMAVANADVIFRVVLNPASITGAAFGYFDQTTSVMQVDKSGSAFTGGRQVFRARVAGGTELSVALKDGMHVQMNPGDIITVTAESAGNSTTADVSLQWAEEFNG